LHVRPQSNLMPIPTIVMYIFAAIKASYRHAIPCLTLLISFDFQSGQKLTPKRYPPPIKATPNIAFLRNVVREV
jgi:hypothetical protein